MINLWIGVLNAIRRLVYWPRPLRRHASSRVAWTADLGGDLRYILRGWSRTPGLSTTIVLTLSLGIALTAAIFSFADGYLFRPLPFPSADQLYFVRDPHARPSALRASDTVGLRQSEIASFGFVEWKGTNRIRGQLVVGDRLIELYAHQVSRRFRSIVPLPLIAGRDFASEDHSDVRPVPAWMNYPFWRREFGGDLNVLGGNFRVQRGLQSVEIVVVGILAPAIASVDINNRPPDILVPALDEPVRGRNQLSFPIVRLPDGMSRIEGEAQIAGVLEAIAPASDGRRRSVKLQPLRESQVAGGRPTARVLFAGALLVMLLAALNVVHLLLTRAVARAEELATRAALGASRWRIARLLWTESLLFGGLGIIGGVTFGAWLSGLIAAGVPAYPTGARHLALVPMVFDWRVVTFAAGLGFVVTFVGAAWPVWLAVRRPLGSMNRCAAGVTNVISTRVSRLILASELSVATIVLLGTAFIGAGIWRYLHQPLGFDYADRFRISIEPAEPRQTTSAELDSIVRAIRDVPGVRFVGQYEPSPIGGVEVGGESIDASAGGASSVSPGYFESWNIRLHVGRWLTDSEFQGGTPVALVDKKLASFLWPDSDPLGQEIRVAGDVLRQVVGVVEPRRWRLDRESAAQVFVPAAVPAPGSALVVWAPLAQAREKEIHTRLTAALQQTTPGAGVRIDLVTPDLLFLRDIGEAQFQAPIVGAFGVLAFALAGIGIFGLVSFLVEQRTREFGIQLALGAGPRIIWQSVMRHVTVPALFGLATGTAAAWGLESVVRSAIFGWEASSAGALTTVILLIAVVSVLAAAGPARRAIRVDPATALRMQ